MILYNPQGLHFAELFAPSLADMMPGLLPTADDPGEEWDEGLMDTYARDIGK